MEKKRGKGELDGLKKECVARVLDKI